MLCKNCGKETKEQTYIEGCQIVTLRSSYCEDCKKQIIKEIEKLTKKIEKHPDNFALYLKRGEYFEKIDDYKQAINDYTEVINKNPDNKKAYFKRGCCYKNQQSMSDHIEQAIKDFSKVIELDNKYEEAYKEKIQCYFCIDKYDEALNELNEYITKHPNAAWTYVERAYANIRNDNDFEAEEDYNKAIELEPDNLSWYYEKIAYYYHGNAYNSEDCYGAYIKRNPNDVQGYEKEIEFCLDRIDYFHLCGDNVHCCDRILFDLKKIIEIEPDNIDNYILREEILLLRKDLEKQYGTYHTKYSDYKMPLINKIKAVNEAFANISKIEKNKKTIDNIKNLIYEQADNDIDHTTLIQIIQFFDNLIETDKQNVENYIKLVIYLEKLKKYISNIEGYDDYYKFFKPMLDKFRKQIVITINSKNECDKENLKTKLKSSVNEIVEEVIEQGLKKDSTNAQLYYLKGKMYADNLFDKNNSVQPEEDEKAEYYFSKAIEIDNRYIEAFWQRGIYYEQRDNIPNAIKDYTAIISLYQKAVSDNTQTMQMEKIVSLALFHKGYIFFDQKQWRKASNDLKKYLELNPEDTEVRYDQQFAEILARE